MARKFKLSKKEKVSELKKCARDPVYFINNYCKIAHPLKGKIPFKTYDYQDDVIRALMSKSIRFNIVLKARQLGLSTITAAYVCWLIIFRNNKEILVVATKEKTAAKLVKKVKLAFNNLPEWVKMGRKKIKDNENCIELDNGSGITASSTSSDAGRSESLSFLIIDEAAHVVGMEDLWTAIYPTLSTGGSCLAISCVTGDTFVITDKGIKEVNDFVQKDKKGGYFVEKYNILGKDKIRKGLLFFNNGFVKTRKIYTINACLEGSLNHKLWAYKKDTKKYDWYKLSELSEGDFISVQYGMNIWGNNDEVGFEPEFNYNHRNIFKTKKITPDIAYVLGLYLSEGSAYKVKNKKSGNNYIGGTVTFTCGDDLTESLENVGLKVSKTKGDHLHHYCSSKTFIDFLEYLGFDVTRKAPQKIIPSRLMQMSKENIAALLSGIFDDDGCARGDRGTVSISLSSKRMIEQIRILLLNMGILTEYNEGICPPTELVKVSSNYYRLEMNSEESAKFYEKIGFRFKRKQENKKILHESNLKRSNSMDIIPNSLQHMKNMFEYYGKGSWSLSHHENFTNTPIFNKTKRYKTEDISRQNIIKMLNIVKDKIPGWYKKELEMFVSPNLRWLPIKKIEEKENETYDFSLPNDESDFWNHSVIYNGILGHQTPKGVGSWYHKTYIDAESGANDFNPIMIPWDAHPDRDQKWFEKETRNMNRQQIAQELLCNFNTSGEGVFNADDIEKLKKMVREPLYKTGFDRNFWIWEKYEPGVDYLMSADVARGDGKDFSTFHIFRLDTLEIIGEYQGKQAPDLFANLIFNVGKEFGSCMIVVENNSIGYTVVDKLIQAEYPNVYHSVKSTNEYVEQHVAEQRSGCIAGFTMSQRTRPLVVAKLEEFVRNKLIKIYSQRMINEMTTFIYNHGRPEAMDTYNDDLVMAAAIGCWVRDTALTVSKRDLEYKKAFLSCFIKSTTSIDTKIPGMDGYRPPKGKHDEKTEDLLKKYPWLFKG